MTPEEALAKAIEWANAAENAAMGSGETLDYSDGNAARLAAVSQAWSFVSLAASNLVPLPEDVLAEAETMAVDRLTEVEGILDHAARETRRHPAIVQSLEVIRRPR